MRCTRPRQVWLWNSDGREAVRQYNAANPDDQKSLKPLFVHPPERYMDWFKVGYIPCGKCLGCLLDRREAWTVRACLEMYDHDVSSFVTLTYSDQFLPASGFNGLPTLERSDFQKFFKRLRSRIAYDCKLAKVPVPKVRYFGCGEYGSKFDRPHYHAIIYGWMPCDITLWSNDGPTYRSKMLEELWTYGFSTVSPANFNTCRYVAGYVGKKIFGTPPEGVDPCFVACSLKPAIGSGWFKRYGQDLVKFIVDCDGTSKIADSKVILPDGKPAHIPQAFLRWWRDVYPEKHDLLLSVNEANPLEFPDQDVLAAREALQEVLFKQSCLKGVRNV